MDKKIITLISFLLIALLAIQFAYAEGNETESGDDESSEIESNSSDDEKESEDEQEVVVTTSSNSTDDDSDENEEDEQEVTVKSSEDETEDEVESMSNRNGAEMRLLQLEKAITRNILGGNEVIAQIEKNGTNVSELESLINKLEALKLEVQELDPSADDAVETFVNIKKDAIETSQEFRKIARSLLKEGDRLEIAKKIKEMNWSEVREYNDRIKIKVRAQNAEIARKTFESLGVDNPELLAKIESGEVSIKEVRVEIETRFKSMSAEEKKESLVKLRESDVKKDLIVREKMEKSRLVQNERTAKRIEYAQKASERIKDPVRKERVQKTLEVRSDKVDQRIEKNTNRIENIKETRQTIRENKNSGGEQ